ncbi:MAG TPA: tyrosine-protein phosphatase, partial [Verrucomicrobiae bacterium]
MHSAGKIYSATLLLFLFAMTLTVAAADATNRPAIWAQPVKIAGISNGYEVSMNLYRGAQPTAAGMKNLQAMGIKTVVNLRAWHSDKDKVAGTGLKSIRFEMEPWRGDTEEVVQFLKIFADTNNLPVFVHCERGSDRTGMMCAMYRITVCGWTKQQAIQEMEKGGFGFNPVWHELTAFIEKADIADIKRRAGL